MDHYLILKNRPKRGRTTVVEWVMEWGGGGKSSEAGLMRKEKDWT